jgi:acetyl esterase
VLIQRPAGGHEETPVVIHLHGGGFVNRYPEQDLHIARALAADLGATVLLPDYDTAPRVRYPVAEEEMFDIARWVQASSDQGWDVEQLMLSGVSAGAKLAINICQQLHAAHLPLPQAVALVVPVTDMLRTDRTSPIRRPAISPTVLRFSGWAYFPDTARRGEPLASPRLDDMLADCMPPTLILTGEHDSLAADGAELAETLRQAGTLVVHHEFAGADHGFIAGRDVSTIRAALGHMTSFLGNSQNTTSETTR